MGYVSRHFGRAGLVFARVLVAVAPALLVAWLGAAHLYSIVDTLLAPGVPVEYSFESESGVSVVRASSYTIDLKSRRAYVYNVTLEDAHGGVAAKAERIDALMEDHGGFDVTISKGDLSVERLPDGSLSIAKALPPPGEAGEGPSVKFHLNQVLVHYLDRAKLNAPISRNIRVSSIDGVSANGDMTVDFLAEEQDLRKAPISIQNDRDGGVWVSANFQNAEVIRLLPVISPWLPKEQRDQLDLLTARSIIADGTARVYSKKDLLEIQGDFSAIGKGVAARGVFPTMDLNVQANGTQSGLMVKATGRRSGVTGSFDGRVVFGKEIGVSGRVTGAAASRASLWREITTNLPKEANFRNARFAGEMRLLGAKAWVSGDLKAELATWDKERVDNLQARVAATPTEVGMRLQNARWSTIGITGGLNYALKSKALLGYFQTTRGRLEPIAKRFGFTQARGIGYAQAVVGGTADKPNVELFARGTGGLKIGDADEIFVRAFEARASIDGETALVNRLIVDSPNGFLTATGELGLKSEGLGLSVQGSGINLGAFVPELDGMGYMQAKIEGTFAKPKVTGVGEAYNLAYAGQNVPQVKADFSYAADQLDLTRLFARVGTGSLEGRGTWNQKTDAVTGEFSGADIQLGQFGNAAVIGWGSIEKGRLTGTLANPLAEATVNARDLVAGGYRVDFATAGLRATREGIDADEFVAVAGPGEVRGSGHFDLTTMQANAFYEAKSMPLGRIPAGTSQVDVRGLADAKGTVTYSEAEGLSANADGTVRNVQVNGTGIGSGFFNFDFTGDQVVGSAEIGDIERYMRLNAFQLDTKTSQLGSEAEIYNFPLASVIEIFNESFATVPDWLKDALNETEGSITGVINASGDVSNPDVGVTDLAANDLKIRGRTLGRAHIDANRAGGRWTINQAALETEDSILRSSGTFEESGTMDLKLDGANVDLSWINALVPDAPQILGTATIYAEAKGTIDAPDVRASLQANLLGAVMPDGNRYLLPPSRQTRVEGEAPKTSPLNLSLENIAYDGKRATGSGLLSWEGFAGNLSLDAPMEAFAPDAKDKKASPASAILTFDQRPIQDFRELFGTSIGPETDGTVQGMLTLGGVSGDFHVNGNVDASGTKLDLSSLETRIVDYTFGIKINDEAIDLSGGFASAEGGRADANLSARLNGLFDGDGEADVMDGSTLGGAINFTNLKMAERLPLAKDLSRLQADGNISINGSLREPRIGGNVRLSGVDLRLPSEFPPGQEGGPLAIDPYFDHLTIEAAEGSDVSIAIGRIRVHGSGDINGPFSALSVRAPMVVESGRLDLPTSRITLDEGGEITVIYANDFNSASPLRVEVDMDGKTTAAVRRFGDQYETYDIYLTFRGDLLNEDGIRMDAYSDPPDLTKDEILAIVGQRELFETLANSAFGERDDAFLRGTLYSIALPTFTRQFTEGIAQSLQLDYVTLDYNPFDQTILRVGKTITKGLVLQYSKQLMEPTIGRQKYELKLSYRPPSQTGILSRFRLSVGLDQDRPWKISLDWARRF
jgi:hypothetical protein